MLYVVSGFPSTGLGAGSRTVTSVCGAGLSGLRGSTRSPRPELAEGRIAGLKAPRYNQDDAWKPY